jgi:hypothetical protein
VAGLNEEYVDVGAEIKEDERKRAWRSTSLKNRMLMIVPNKEQKHEWIVLPQLPSKVEQQDEVFKQQTLQNFHAFLS